MLLAVVVTAFYVIKYVTADARGTVSAREQIKGSGTYRIAAYNDFFDLCAAVQADEARIRALRAEPNPTPVRVSQISASITAITASRAEKIATYNANARKDYTVGQFRASSLPFALDPDREVTTCTL